MDTIVNPHSKSVKRRRTLSALSCFVTLLVLPTYLSARDFTYTYEGQTLTYTVLNENAKTCTTKAGVRGNAAGNNVSGELNLPEHPKDGEIEYTLTAIGESAFEDCLDLTSVSIPNSVITIGEGAFYYCLDLTSVSIPNSVTTIDYGAFFDCSGLTAVTIPNSVTTIGDWAFADCTGLTEIYALPTVPPSVGEEAFNEVPRDIAVYVPKGTIPTYSEAEVWNEFTNYHEIEGLDSIEDLEDDNRNASAEYFTLQGQRVSADHVTSGVYIVRRGDRITKTYIR